MAVVNNEFYDRLGEEWYNNKNFSMSVLREQGNAKNPWAQNKIEKYLGSSPQQILDIGCGGGFLSNYLAEKGHQVTGIDINPNNLQVAKKYDATKTVSYVEADARDLKFPDESFSVAAAMDVLEHVEELDKLISEASRVLKKGGLFIFHTFNRTLLARIIGVWGLNLMPGVPLNTHIYRLFIKPEELTAKCSQHQMRIAEMSGINTNIKPTTVLKAFAGIYCPEEVHFTFTNSLKASYLGVAIKE